MARVVYLNGRYVPYGRASVHIDDRGYQFADGVYEVCAVRGGVLIDEAPHLKRLGRSLGELRIAWPIGVEQLRFVMRETVRRNLVGDGLVYVQISRGVARRDHPFPTPGVKSSLVVTARNLAVQNYETLATAGVGVIALPETRWARCDIKSTSLLANVLAKQQAREAGAFEAWFVDRDGYVTEGASTNAWIVDRDGVLRTRRLNQAILPGVTRGEIIPICARLGIGVEETAFTVEAAKASREAFITAASAGVTPVISVDGVRLGDGKPGPVAAALREAYWASRQSVG